MVQKTNAKKISKQVNTVDSEFKLTRALGLLIFIIGFIIYFNSIKNNYALDDFSTIKENHVTTKGLKAIPDIFSHFYRYGYYTSDDGIYRPLSVTFFAIEWAVSPDNPSLAHFVNVFLYALTGLVLFITLKRILKDYNLILPFIITLLFITHPVHTEVVANIKSLDEILCFLFSFLSLYFLLDYIENKKTAKLLMGVLSFFAALLSKESAITMLALFPLVFLYFENGKRKEIIISAAGITSAAILFLCIRAVVLSKSMHTQAIEPLLNPLLLVTDPINRFGNEMRVLGYYIKLLVYPSPLVYDYSYGQISMVSSFDFFAILSVLLYAGLLIYAIIGFFKKNLLAIGILFFMITLVIFSNIFITLSVLMAERFVYFASLGFCFYMGVLLIKATKTQIEVKNYSGLSSFFSGNKKVVLICFGISFIYATMTINRNKDWKDNYTLFSHDITLMTDNARAHTFLGNEIIKTIAPKQNDNIRFIEANMKGISELKTALAIYPDNVEALNCIGTAYTQVDSLDKAEFYFAKALKLDPKNPGYMAGLYLAKRDYANSIRLYNEIVKKDSSNLDGLVYLGISYGAIKKYKESIACLQKTITIEPASAKIYYYLSSAYQYSGDTNNAEKYFQKAYRLDPTLTRP